MKSAKNDKENGDLLNGSSEKGSEYLLSIEHLLNEKGYVRGVELADLLGKSRPTVTRALQRLSSKGLVNYERYRGITLTSKGKEQAEIVQKRYSAIKDFLEAAGLKSENAEIEAQRMVPYISDEVLSVFRKAEKAFQN